MKVQKSTNKTEATVRRNLALEATHHQFSCNLFVSMKSLLLTEARPPGSRPRGSPHPCTRGSRGAEGRRAAALTQPLPARLLAVLVLPRDLRCGQPSFRSASVFCFDSPLRPGDRPGGVLCGKAEGLDTSALLSRSA